MQPAFVVDCGTSQCRAGLATMKLLPSFVCDTVVGKEKTEAVSAVQKAEAAMAGLAGMATAKAPVWIGEELADLGDSLDMVYPMSNGRITDWDSADRLLHAVVASKLGIKLDEHPVFFVEQPLAVRNDREKYVSMLFESFSAPAVFLASSAVTSLYANNMTSGLVVSCGESNGKVVPVLEGHEKRHHVLPLQYGGATLSRILEFECGKRAGAVPWKRPRQAQVIKDAFCFVSEDFGKDMALTETTGAYQNSYTLPDGNIVMLQRERFKTAEIMFQPDLFPDTVTAVFDGKAPFTLQSQVVECLLQFKDDRRADLCNNVLVAGGTMSMANTAPRLQREVQPLCEDEEITTPVSVRACKHGGVLDAWIGAAAMSQLSVWPELLITKAEFEEAGADVANRKCM